MAIKVERKFVLLVADLGAFIEKLYTVVATEDGSEQLVVEVAGKLDDVAPAVRICYLTGGNGA